MTDMPRIRDLYVVREAYRHRRISAAAELVHLSQPAATQALGRVETLLGVDLFERQPKGLVPTELGERFEVRLLRLLEHLKRGDKLACRKATSVQALPPRKGFHRFCSPVQLRALLAMARAGSFSQAAQDLGVSQPGVHRAMRELGSLSGVELFDQTRGGVVLTAAAELLAHEVNLATSEFRQAAFEVNEALGRDSTRINIGSMPLSRAAILPSAIAALTAEYGARVQINCVDARYNSLLRDLRFGELDVLIGALRSPAPADVDQEPLFADSLAVITAPDHPLTAWATVTLDDTLHFPWIAPPKTAPSGAYLYDKLRIQDMANTPVRIVSSSLVLVRELLARGPYVSIASVRQIEADEARGSLVRLPVDLPDSARPIGLSFRTGWMPTPVQKRFLDIIRDQCRTSA